MAKQKTTQKLGHCRNTRDADEKRLGEIGRRISVLEGEIGARQEELSGLRKEACRIKARIQYADEKKARASIEAENAKLKAETSASRNLSAGPVLMPLPQMMGAAWTCRLSQADFFLIR